MANLVQYTIANIYVDGSLLAEEATLTIDRDTKAIPIETVVKGFAGVSPGAAVVNLTVDNAVPAADFELNPGKYMNSGIPKAVSFTMFAAGRTLTVNGFILKDNFAAGVNQAAKLSFTAMCEYGDWV